MASIGYGSESLVFTVIPGSSSGGVMSRFFAALRNSSRVGVPLTFFSVSTIV